MRQRDGNRSGSTRAARRMVGSADLRARIAAEAARIISESGVRDYAFAKRKAAARLDAQDEASAPGNDEIEEALRLHQRLFLADEQPRQLRRLRRTALEAMRFLAEFSPRLVGAVLDGSADGHSAVCLHLFSDDPDAPARFLDERGIRCRAKSRRLRLSDRQYKEFPALLFEADGTTIDLTIFTLDGARLAPFDSVTGKPMQRAAAQTVGALLEKPD